MKKGIMIISMMSLIVLFQCEKNNITAPGEVNYTEGIVGMVEVDEADIEVMLSENLAKDNTMINSRANEVRLKYFAKGVAKLLGNAEIRSYLKNEIGKQFDGDFDALWETVKTEHDGAIRKSLEKIYYSDSQISMIDEIEKVPLLQISLPVNFDNWDGSESILVAYDPITIDDDECKQIVAYDGEGKEYILDTKNDPEFPVIVVGINERMNDISGNRSNKKILYPSHDLQVVHFRLMDDHEPWWKGDPEIYTKAKVNTAPPSYWITTNFSGVNDEKTYYDWNYSWLPKTIYNTGSSSTFTILMEVWEDDGSSGDDLLEDEWTKDSPSGPDANPTNFTENTWFYGKSNDADLFIDNYHYSI